MAQMKAITIPMKNWALIWKLGHFRNRFPKSCMCCMVHLRERVWSPQKMTQYCYVGEGWCARNVTIPRAVLPDFPAWLVCLHPDLTTLLLWVVAAGGGRLLESPSNFSTRNWIFGLTSLSSTMPPCSIVMPELNRFSFGDAILELLDSLPGSVDSKRGLPANPGNRASWPAIGWVEFFKNAVRKFAKIFREKNIVFQILSDTE